MPTVGNIFSGLLIWLFPSVYNVLPSRYDDYSSLVGVSSVNTNIYRALIYTHTHTTVVLRRIMYNSKMSFTQKHLKLTVAKGKK